MYNMKCFYYSSSSSPSHSSLSDGFHVYKSRLLSRQLKIAPTQTLTGMTTSLVVVVPHIICCKNSFYSLWTNINCVNVSFSFVYILFFFCSSARSLLHMNLRGTRHQIIHTLFFTTLFTMMEPLIHGCRVISKQTTVDETNSSSSSMTRLHV